MAEYGPLTPSNRREWFLMNGGSGGSGGGGGVFKDVDVAIANDTEDTLYCVLGTFFYEDGVATLNPTIAGVNSGNTHYAGFNAPESAESIQYFLYIAGDSYTVTVEGGSAEPMGEVADVTIGDTTFRLYKITASAPIDELNITISEDA